MKQEELNQFDAELTGAVNQYMNGMITIVELTRFCADMHHRMPDTNLAGLIDPQSGLKFPTAEEIAAIDAETDSIGPRSTLSPQDLNDIEEGIPLDVNHGDIWGEGLPD